MKKRFGTLMITLVLIFTLVIPAGAAAPQISNNLDVLSDEEIADLYYEKHTITFEKVRNDGVTLSDKATASSNDMDYDTHLENVAAARDFVISLGLKEQGLALVEEACLRELEAYAEMDDIVLESYTVLTPNNVTRATPSGLTLLGSKNGRSFYYNLTSQASYGAQKVRNKNLTTIQNWVNGGVDIVLSFVSKKYTIPYTIFKTLLGTPSNWTVVSGSYVENYVRVNPTTRNIYTQVATNQWRCLLSNQTGSADPATLFYNMDPNYEEITKKSHGRQAVSTPNYSNTSLMINMAYSQWESSAYGNDPFTQTLAQNLDNLGVSWE